MAEVEQVAGGVGIGVRQQRHHVDLGVPEVVTVVAVGRDPLGGDAASVDLRRGLRHLEQVPADRLLGRVVAVDGDVGARPEPVEPRLLLGERPLPAGCLGGIERAAAAGGELVDRHVAGWLGDLAAAVVGDVLGERDRVARFGVEADRGGGAIAGELGVERNVAAGQRPHGGTRQRSSSHSRRSGSRA